MWRRWIIRGFFIGMLVLCVAGWVGSQYYVTQMICRSRRTVVVDAEPQTLYLVWWQDASPSTTLEFHGYSHSGYSYRGILDEPRVRWWGFAEGLDPNVHRWWYLGVPFWFLTAVATFALLVAWRKTRPHLSSDTAFPVEIAATEEKR